MKTFSWTQEDDTNSLNSPDPSVMQPTSVADVEPSVSLIQQKEKHVLPAKNMDTSPISISFTTGTAKQKKRSNNPILVICVVMLIILCSYIAFNSHLMWPGKPNTATISAKPTATSAMTGVQISPTTQPSPASSNTHPTATSQPGRTNPTPTASTSRVNITPTAGIINVPQTIPTLAPTHAPTPTPAPVLTSFNASGGSPYDVVTNLTNVGSVDWVHWGYPSASDANRKSGVTPWISSASWSGTLTDDTNQPSDFTWTDGAPSPNEDALTSGTDTNGSVSFTVASNQTVHTLRIYAGSYLAKGTLYVSFGGTVVYTGSFDLRGDGGDTTKFTINYSSNVDSYLTVSYVMTAADGHTSNVLLEAAALS